MWLSNECHLWITKEVTFNCNIEEDFRHFRIWQISVLSCCCTWFLFLQIYISTLSQFYQCFESVGRPYSPQKQKDTTFTSSDRMERSLTKQTFFFMSLRSESRTNLEMHIYDFWEILYDWSSKAEIKYKNQMYSNCYSIDWISIKI